MQTRERVGRLWCNNCLLIRGTRGNPFLDDGDSGSVVFDTEGAAVGLLFGSLRGVGNIRLYGVASPMEAVLKKLEEPDNETSRKFKLRTYSLKGTP